MYQNDQNIVVMRILSILDIYIFYNGLLYFVFMQF